MSADRKWALVMAAFIVVCLVGIVVSAIVGDKLILFTACVSLVVCGFRLIGFVAADLRARSRI